MSDIRNRICMVFALLACLMPTLVGCADREGDQTTDQSPVDSRFASPEALIDYYNTLTTREPVQIAAVYELYYAENALQQRIIDFDRSTIAIKELDTAMKEQFGEPWNPSMPNAFKVTSNTPARIVERQNGRVLAECEEEDGTLSRIYLVKIGDRWWLSGYTVEREPGVSELLKSKDFEATEKLQREFAPKASALAARIQASEFDTAQQAREALRPE